MPSYARSGHGKTMVPLKPLSLFLLLVLVGSHVGNLAWAAEATWLERSSAHGSQILVTVFHQAPKTPAHQNPVEQAAQSQALILNTLGNDFELTYRYNAVPALTGWMSAEAYRALDPQSRSAASLSLSARSALHISPEQSGRGDPTISAAGTGALGTSRSVVNAQSLQDMGFTGAGQRIAIVDTGVDLDNLDFFGRVIAEACFCTRPGSNCCPNQQASQVGSGSGQDDNGHGTNVAGIAAAGGTHTGMAPGAEIVSVKTIDNNNAFYTFSDQIAALDWLFTQNLGLSSVNMSLGTNQLFSGSCDNQFSFLMATQIAVNNLNSLGTEVIAAAGNQFADNLLPAPACVSNVVAVGATNDADAPQAFSNTSALVELFAPGVNISASGLNSGGSTYTGTSMSAPHVAGGIVLLASALPAAGAESLVDSLKATGPIVTDRLGNDIPRINLLAAYENTLASLVPSTPTISGIEPENGQLVVYFSVDQLGDSGSNFSYEVSCQGGGQIATATGTSSPITVTGLSNGVAYSCTIFAIGPGGNSPTSNVVGPVTPQEPQANSLPIWLLYEANQ